MRLIIIYCLTCIFHYAGHSNNSPFSKADSLVKAGELNWALMEYERIIYATTDNVVRTNALLKKSECYILLQDFKSAEKNLQRIFYSGLSDSLQYKAHYNAAFYAYLNKNYNQSISELVIIDNFLPDSIKTQSYILYALVLNENREWEKAKEKLQQWTNYTYANNTILRDSIINKISELYNSKNYPKYKSPEKAHLYSSFVPGLGQLYSGYLADAIFSVLMQLTGIGVAAYGILVAKYYVTGFVLGYGIFQRFYISGTKRAEFLAKKHNYITARKYNDQLKDFLLKFPEQIAQ